MTAEQYLGKVEKLDLIISQDIERLNELRITAEGVRAIRYDRDPVQTSPSGDRLLDDVAKILELEDKLRHDITVAEQVKDQITREIQALDDPKEIDVLYRRYVRRQSMNDIADETNLSLRQAMRVLQDALNSFDVRMHVIKCH